MKISRFEWDGRNAGHIEERHGLSPAEVEEVFSTALLSAEFEEVDWLLMAERMRGAT